MNSSGASALIILLLVVGTNAFWQNEWDEPHDFTCPSGKAVSRIQSEHDNRHEDRRWEWSCKDTPAFVGNEDDCEWTGYVNSMDGNLNYECPSDKFIVGTYSYHDNHHEDRRFKYNCCRMRKGCKREACTETSYINSYDGGMDYSLPDHYQIAGLWSEHNSHHEDRHWKVRICKAACGPEATYKLKSVEWDKSVLDGVGTSPKVVDGTTVKNPTPAEVEKTLSFSSTTTESTTTHWSRTLGAEVSFTVSTAIKIVDVSVTATLSYEYTQGASTTITESKTITQSYTLKVPANTSIQANMVLKETPEVTVPFVATFEKTEADGKTTIVKEAGTWTGVFKSDEYIEVNNI